MAGLSSCIVVGAGDGIGAAVARRFATEGFHLGLVARDEARLRRLADALGPSASIATADVADTKGLTAALADLQAADGPAEVLVYNAAMATPGPAGDVTPQQLSGALDVNVIGAVTATRAVLASMRERQSGTLLFTGGGLALQPAGALAALSVGKAAIRAWALALHQDLAPQGVHAATVTVAGLVASGTRFDPDAIADWYWRMHVQPPEDWQAEHVFD